MSMETSDNSLRKNRLGVLGIVFFVVAASAPLVGMTGAVPVAMVIGNQTAVPGTYLFVGIVLLLFSVGFATMSSHVTNAGAFFAYVGRGLGRPLGVGSAFAMIVGYVTIQLAIYGFFGFQLNAYFASKGITIDWYIWVLIAFVLVSALSLLSVDVGAKILGVLMILEILSLLISGIIIMAHHIGSVDLMASFSPTNIFAGGFAGGAGIAIAFAFASFIGFEATAIYGEESKDPKRTVPRATYWAIGIITALFTFVSLAVVAGYNNDLSKLTATPDDVLGLVSTEVGPWMVDAMSILVMSSLFAGLLAFQNANSRYIFALGRAGVFPKSMSKTNASGSPINGVIVTSVLAFIIFTAFKLANLDPFAHLFTWMSAITSVAIILVELLVCLAVIVYFSKNKGENVLKVLVAPLLAIVGLLVGEYLLMSRFNLLGGLASADVTDPTAADAIWKLSDLGWVLALSPFIALALGALWSVINKNDDSKMSADILS